MARKLISLAIALAGTVFFLQGTGLFTPGDSYMNHNPNWAVIGVVMLVVGLIFWPRQRG